jgi:membrane-associated progesterone receptor component
LAKNSFDADMMVDPKGAIDKLEDLEADEWESLREWVIRTSVMVLFDH